MNIENSLISTALLALQQSSQVQFAMATGIEGDDKSGFWFKKSVNEDEDDEMSLQVLIYMDEESPTGYGVIVEALDDEITLLDQPITSFKEFQKIFHSEYIQNVFDTHQKTK